MEMKKHIKVHCSSNQLHIIFDIPFNFLEKKKENWKIKYKGHSLFSFSSSFFSSSSLQIDLIYHKNFYVKNRVEINATGPKNEDSEIKISQL